MFKNLVLSVLMAATLFGCSHAKQRSDAMAAAARFWQDKAYPGKAFDVSVVDAESIDDGRYRVKGVVDGESRVGIYNPDTRMFSEGDYAVAKDWQRKLAEMQGELKYWKDKSESLDRENYKLKVKLGIADDAPKSAAPATPSQQ